MSTYKNTIKINGMEFEISRQDDIGMDIIDNSEDFMFYQIWIRLSDGVLYDIKPKDYSSFKPDDRENLRNVLEGCVIVHGPIACGKSNYIRTLSSFEEFIGVIFIEGQRLETIDRTIRANASRIVEISDYRRTPPKTRTIEMVFND